MPLLAQLREYMQPYEDIFPDKRLYRTVLKRYGQLDALL